MLKIVIAIMALMICPVALADGPIVQDKGISAVKVFNPQTVEPKDIPGAAVTAKKAIDAAKEGKWWYFSALVCLMLMFILKITNVLKNLGQWKYVILPVLSITAALLAAFQGGVSFDTAWGVFTSSWATGMLQEAWEHGIKGVPHGSS